MKDDIEVIPGLVKSGNWKRALGIVKRHNFKLSPEELREIQLGLEHLNGRGNFYQQLGVNCEKALQTAKELVKLKYCDNSEKLCHTTSGVKRT